MCLCTILTHSVPTLSLDLEGKDRKYICGTVVQGSHSKTVLNLAAGGEHLCALCTCVGSFPYYEDIQVTAG